jgi:pyruvate/2-oxoglutarate dehydrogenase complex dihydrolipoamide dehydrogenase (E3) component
VRIFDVVVIGAGPVGENVAARTAAAGLNTVLGATFVGRGVAELLQSATFAITGEIPLDRLWHAVPAFPTLSEVWLRLLETYRDTPRP